MSEENVRILFYIVVGICFWELLQAIVKGFLKGVSKSLKRWER